MSSSANHVISTKFGSTLGISIALHLAALGGLASGARHTPTAPTATMPVPVDFAPAVLGNNVQNAWEPSLPVEVEPLAALPDRVAPERLEPVKRQQSLSRRPERRTANDSQVPHARLPSKDTPETTALASAAASNGPSDALAPIVAEPSIERSALRQAMAAAATASSRGNAEFTQPVVRVDPLEKNLARALARAFAWAFAVDRSFFASVPTGRTRFVVDLADDGRIGNLSWVTPPPPERLKQLVQRMTKLLSVNHFSLSSDGSDPSRHRAFSMTVTEHYVPAPREAGRADGQAGDLWMLGAGETPTVGRPSHPSVADVTGHRVDCELEILVPLPEIAE